MAEQAGLDRPYRMQSLLGRSSWDADRLCDLVRAEVIGSLGDPGGVLVVDETGFLKKGTRSVGVARQYSGTAGRIENCQVGVFLGYASPLGQALIDRRLYLPEAWAGDEARRRRVQVPETVQFATKPQIACALIASALDAGVPCAWVLADALYGETKADRMAIDAAAELLGEEEGRLGITRKECRRADVNGLLGRPPSEPTAQARAAADLEWLKRLLWYELRMRSRLVRPPPHA